MRRPRTANGLRVLHLVERGKGIICRGHGGTQTAQIAHAFQLLFGFDLLRLVEECEPPLAEQQCKPGEIKTKPAKCQPRLEHRLPSQKLSTITLEPALTRA